MSGPRTLQGRIMARDGDLVDQIAQEAYGRTAGATEALLAANPHLAALPARLPAGTLIDLPEIPAEVATRTIKLWD